MCRGTVEVPYVDRESSVVCVIACSVRDLFLFSSVMFYNHHKFNDLGGCKFSFNFKYLQFYISSFLHLRLRTRNSDLLPHHEKLKAKYIRNSEALNIVKTC